MGKYISTCTYILYMYTIYLIHIYNIMICMCAHVTVLNELNSDVCVFVCMRVCVCMCVYICVYTCMCATCMQMHVIYLYYY